MQPLFKNTNKPPTIIFIFILLFWLGGRGVGEFREQKCVLTGEEPLTDSSGTESKNPGPLTSPRLKVWRLTQLLVFIEAHDGHGLQGFLEHLIVLGSRDGHIAIGEERVVAEALQKQVTWQEGKKGYGEEGTQLLWTADWNLVKGLDHHSFCPLPSASSHRRLLQSPLASYSGQFMHCPGYPEIQLWLHWLSHDPWHGVALTQKEGYLYLNCPKAPCLQEHRCLES